MEIKKFAPFAMIAITAACTQPEPTLTTLQIAEIECRNAPLLEAGVSPHRAQIIPAIGTADPAGTIEPTKTAVLNLREADLRGTVIGAIGAEGRLIRIEEMNECFHFSRIIPDPVGDIIVLIGPVTTLESNQ